VVQKPGIHKDYGPSGELIAVFTRQGKLYHLNTIQFVSDTLRSSYTTQTDYLETPKNIRLWYKRLAHLKNEDIKKFSKMAEGCGCIAKIRQQCVPHVFNQNRKDIHHTPLSSVIPKSSKRYHRLCFI